MDGTLYRLDGQRTFSKAESLKSGPETLEILTFPLLARFFSVR